MDDTRRVLDLLAQGKVTVDQADQLLRALNDASRTETAAAAAAAPSAEPAPPATKPRFIRIHVHKPGKNGKNDEDVNIRVPLAILRGGMRLSTMIPGLQQRMNAKFRESGMDVDLSKFDPSSIETLLKDMGELNIDINDGGEQVRITCE